MRIISVVFILLLSGCATEVVKVPIPILQPKPVLSEKIKLPLAELKRDSAPDSVISAYVRTVRLLILDNKDLRARCEN